MEQAQPASREDSGLPNGSQAELALIRRLWKQTRRDAASLTDVELEDELESYIQASLGDLGLTLKSLDLSKEANSDQTGWPILLEIAGKSAALLASLAKRRS